MQIGESATVDLKLTPVWILIMGVSGSGKSTISQSVADRLGGEYIEGDDFHSPKSKEKMKAGIPLNEEDREPWLEAILGTVRSKVEYAVPVVACSALREVHRTKLAELPYMLIYLKDNFAQIEQRIKSRTSHFMPVCLLESQFETLEEPGNALVIPAGLDKYTVTEKVIAHWLKTIKVK